MDNKNASAENVTMLNMIVDKVNQLHATTDVNDTGVNHHDIASVLNEVERLKRNTAKVVAREWPKPQS